MDWATVAGVAGVISSVTVIVVACVAVWRRVLRPLAVLAEDWIGEPERRGPSGVVVAAARPGVMERLAELERQMSAIHKEMHPNGGSSLRDAVNKLLAESATRSAAD